MKGIPRWFVVMGALSLCPILFAVEPAPTTRYGIDYETHIKPIVEKSCLECHRATYKDDRGRTRKPKGDLRLDGKAWILLGGEEGNAVVPGSPAKSALYGRITLDPDDSDFMPNKGDPLTARETELIRRWIADGADFGNWTGTAGPEPEVSVPGASGDTGPATSRLAVFRDLAENVEPLSAGQITRSRGKLAKVIPVAPGNPLLRADFISHESQVTDRDVSTLLAAGDNITQLDLGRTAVTDNGLTSVGKMPRLTVLDLNRTAVTDRGLTRLEDLGELRYLNLFGTEVTDRGLEALYGLKKLENVYLWQTGVTAEGVSKLREQLPDVRVVLEPLFPEAVPRDSGDSEGPPGRRRDI